MSEDNHNELENLFQRASEHYPLNTESANWNAVLDKLEQERTRKGFVIKRGFVYLFILLAVSMLTSYFMHLFMVWNEKNNALKVPTLKEQKASESKMLKQITDAVYEQIKDSINQNFPLQKNAFATLKVISIPVKKNARLFEEVNLTKTDQNTSTIVPPINTAMEAGKNARLPIATDSTSTISFNHAKASKPDSGAKNDLVEAVAKNNMQDSSTSNASMEQTYNSTLVKVKKAPFKKYFYTGAMYATDKSSINFEASKGLGYSMALVLGYQFSKRFSLETGIHIEKKEYYTKGEHFDKSILPAIGKILWIESENKLIEIPLSLKTDLLGNQHHQLFGSFGISSFLVNNESYEYEEEVNGVIQSESVEFTKNTSNLFATTNISLGYEYKIKNRFRLRIEPYLNLPLSGIGKGKEPVLSKGVYFGLLYNFHNK